MLSRAQIQEVRDSHYITPSLFVELCLIWYEPPGRVNQYLVLKYPGTTISMKLVIDSWFANPPINPQKHCIWLRTEKLYKAMMVCVIL